MPYRITLTLLIVLLASPLASQAEPDRNVLLIKTLTSDKDAWARQGAAYQLGQQKRVEKAVVEALGLAIQDRDWGVAYESTRALINVVGPDSVTLRQASKRFSDGLSHLEPEVRKISARAMILLRSPSGEIRRRLVSALRDRDKDVARMSLLALGASRHPNIRSYLVNALDARDWETRQFAAKALGLYADIRLGGELAISLQDPIQAVRWAALQSLIAIGPSQAEHIALALKDSDASIRKLAQHTLLNYQESGRLQTASMEAEAQ